MQSVRFKTNSLFNTLIIFFIVINLACTKSELESSDSLSSQRTLKNERTAFKNNLINNTIVKAFSYPLTDSTEADWQGAIWGMQLAQYRNSLIDSSIESAMSNLSSYSNSMQRSLLEIAYSMYQGVFIKDIESKLNEIENEKVFAMAVEYLMQVQNVDKLIEYQLLMKSKFSSWNENPILYMLNNRMDEHFGNISYVTPPLKDLFKKNINPDYMTIFSFYRNNRDYIGQTIFRKKDGTFLRDSTGKLISVKQFARSVTNLPPYLTNGNTPQGLYVIKGFDISENVFIGPSKNIQTRLPIEVSLGEFLFDDKNNNSWTIEEYKNLLPETWKDYFPIYEAYYAGKAGRTEIIAHGTTINPEFYSKYSFYPYTPSLGCMTTKELWSLETGERLESDQQKLIDIIESLQTAFGYWIIIELDDKQEDVTINEIENLFSE